MAHQQARVNCGPKKTERLTMVTPVVDDGKDDVVAPDRDGDDEIVEGADVPGVSGEGNETSVGWDDSWEDEEEGPALPSYFLPDFWAVFALLVTCLLHALLALVQHWAAFIEASAGMSQRVVQ